MSCVTFKVMARQSKAEAARAPVNTTLKGITALLCPWPVPGTLLAHHINHFIQYANVFCRLYAGDEVFAVHDQGRGANRKLRNNF